ncbi:hypothetical protein CVV70_04425 [Ralstonia solanacearum]|nr:hypothetical protein CCY86_18285 [Ralstonia solanacearum]OPK48867.1 hypothetical protein B5G54_09095 [Ralstonia solanacearum]OPK54499.1 hypothetical protein B5J95_13445 [Ralstonia solanacearum]OPK58813.1 hypothetical protein B5S37_06580 [Ralstonia solanacearum]OYQ02308.1 hypothetical protein B7R79_19300 [Ralstonia solanacearum]
MRRGVRHVENVIPLASVTRPIQGRAPAACHRNKDHARTSGRGVHRAAAQCSLPTPLAASTSHH